ncbi:hypothetical protein, partial [Phocaeicola vulgatus]|uniref:hypothetical protein n=2 Tax=Bacteroidaceae TaxID=815 RepID=UPI0034A5C656
LWMELFSIRIQRTFQLVSTAEYEEIIDKSAKSNKLAEIAAKAAGVKDHPRPEQPTDQTQDYANNKPTRKSLL